MKTRSRGQCHPTQDDRREKYNRCHPTGDRQRRPDWGWFGGRKVTGVERLTHKEFQQPRCAEGQSQASNQCASPLPEWEPNADLFSLEICQFDFFGIQFLFKLLPSQIKNLL